jgi:DNA repair exonuclease SbcCD ATPase subunit
VPNDDNDLTVERISKVEAQMTYVMVEQSNFRTILDKQNALLEALSKQATEQVYQTKAVIDRTDTHNKEIENLQKESVDVGKVLEAMKVQVNLSKYIAGAALAGMIGYLFSHFLK